MSRSEEEQKKRAYEAAQMGLDDANARTRRLEAETFERMNLPSNLGWFKQELSGYETVYYYLTKTGELVRFLDNPEPEPWPIQARLELPAPKPEEPA